MSPLRAARYVKAFGVELPADKPPKTQAAALHAQMVAAIDGGFRTAVLENGVGKQVGGFLLTCALEVLDDISWDEVARLLREEGKR